MPTESGNDLAYANPARGGTVSAPGAAEWWSSEAALANAERKHSLQQQQQQQQQQQGVHARMQQPQQQWYQETLTQQPQMSASTTWQQQAGNLASMPQQHAYGSTHQQSQYSTVPFASDTSIPGASHRFEVASSISSFRSEMKQMRLGAAHGSLPHPHMGNQARGPYQSIAQPHMSMTSSRHAEAAPGTFAAASSAQYSIGALDASYGYSVGINGMSSQPYPTQYSASNYDSGFHSYGQSSHGPHLSSQHFVQQQQPRQQRGGWFHPDARNGMGGNTSFAPPYFSGPATSQDHVNVAATSVNVPMNQSSNGMGPKSTPSTNRGDKSTTEDCLMAKVKALVVTELTLTTPAATSSATVSGAKAPIPLQSTLSPGM
jgi:hypothetical protein